MAVDSDLIATFYNNKNYKKIISKIDASGGFDTCKSKILEEYYIMSCYYLKKPRKLDNTLKIMVALESNNEVLIRLLKTALEQKSNSTVDSIEKNSKKGSKLETNVKALILNSIMKEKYADKNSTTLLVSERICYLLNSKNFYDLKDSKEFIETIRVRVQKIFRTKNYDRIITWLSNLKILEENFLIYRFFILSKRGVGDTESVIRLCEKTIRDLNRPSNIEWILDILYTAGENKLIGELLSNYDINKMTFRANLIYARSLKKLGDIKKSELIIEGAKNALSRQIEEEDMEIETAIKNIKEIGFSGDINLSEHLLFNMISSERFSSKLIKSKKVHEMVNLFQDTLDRQKRIKLADDLEISKMLMKQKSFQTVIRLLKPYIMHGIRNSADLFEFYTLALKNEDLVDQIDELVYSYSNDLKLATAERMANFLEINGLYRQHKILFELMQNDFLDSFKLIRSHFNVLEKYSVSATSESILIRISTIKKPKAGTIIYFVDRYSRMGNFSNIETLMKTIRVNKVTKIICSLRILNINNIRSDMADITNDIMALSIEEKKKSIFMQMIKEFTIVAYRNYEFKKIINVIRKFELDKNFDNQIISTYINSLIDVENYDEVGALLNKYRDDFSDIQRWRFMIEIGNNDEVNNDLDDYNNSKLSPGDDRNLTALLFKLGRFREYIDITKRRIHQGEFTLSTLTRHFYSLYKLGDDFICKLEYKKLYLRFCHKAEKRAIIAILGYDFNLSTDYLDELELSILMEPKGHKISLMIANAFLNLERVDIAFKFFKHALINGQNEFKVIEVGVRIEKLLIDLSIDPLDFSDEQILSKPIYTDVAVIRELIKTLESNKSKKRKKKYSIGIQSHTLDIGGAERQVSYLLNLLHRGKIKSKNYSLITHKTPNLSKYEATYYPKIIDKNIDIIEYIKTPNFEHHVKINSSILDIISHLNILKERRLRNLIQIYMFKNFDIVHTWQDYCNIYGGIAALIAGSRVIMSARTLPPPQKGRLAARSGRSYKECYQLLLTNGNIILTHNSTFGKDEYIRWLGAPKEKNFTIHNGVDVSFTNDNIENINLIESLELEKNSMIIGYVGRFTTDKRPWLFLKTAEEILISNNVKGERSKDLLEWYESNENIINNEDNNRDIKNLERPIHFVMLGDGPQFERAKEIISTSNILNGRIHLMGFSNKVNLYLDEFDCFLLTSKVEGLPNVIIEAQSRGIPVVSTDVGGAKECILEDETGFISSNDDPKNLAGLVIKILSDKKFMKSVGLKSPKFILNKFGEETWSKNMNKLYLEELT